jgi:hypothetical protein
MEREIRASERRFYQKLTDIYSLAVDCWNVPDRIQGALTRSNGGRFLNKFRFESNSMFREFGSRFRQ